MQSEVNQEFLLAALDLLLRGGSGAGVSGDGPKISVIMPVLDRAGMIEDALASLERQSCRDFEAIVVDDGSTDGTAETLQRWKQRAPWIRVLVNPQRQGQSRSRNRALEAATGEIIVYLDSDNLLYPHALAVIKDAFATSPDTWSIYTSQLWVESGHSFEVRCPKISLSGLLSMDESIDLNAFAHRRSLFQVLGGFDERLSRLADLELIMRYAKVILPRRIPIPTNHYRHGDWARASNRALFGWNLHLIRERHAMQISDSLRVLYIVHAYPQVSETYIVSEYRYMLSRGVRIAIWSANDPQTPDPDLPGSDPIIVFRGKLADAISDFRPHILHTHWSNLLEQHAETLLASGLPVTVRGHSFEFSPELLARILQQPAIRRVYVFPTQAPLVSTRDERIKEAPSCFDPGTYKPSPEKDRKLVFRAGISLPTKDIESFMHIALRCPRHKFVLFVCGAFGNPGHLDSIQRENERLGFPVEIHTNRPATEVATWMRRAGIYLHSYNAQTSKFGMPISIAEALATGAYVVARRAAHIGNYAASQDRLFESNEQAAELINATLEWTDARWDAEMHLSIERAFLNHVPAIAVGPILDDWLSITGSSYVRPCEATRMLAAKVGQRIFFGLGGEGVGLLRAGFHRSESWGVWSAQCAAAIALVTEGPGWPDVRSLSLELFAIPAREGPLPVSVSVNRHLVGEISALDEIRQYTLPLTDLTLETGQLLHIALETRSLWTPWDGGSQDHRRLGFGLMRVSFESR